MNFQITENGQTGEELHRTATDSLEDNAESCQDAANIDAEECRELPEMQAAPKRKKSFFSGIMARKELAIQLKLNGYIARENEAQEGIRDATARLAQAKSRLPLMIVEKRIPRMEAVDKKQAKLQVLVERLESLNIYNQRTEDFINKWRTLEGKHFGVSATIPRV